MISHHFSVFTKIISLASIITVKTRISLQIAFAWLLLAPQLTFAQRTATATATVVNGFIVAITITDPGVGYTRAPNIRIVGGGGTGAAAVASLTANGSIDQIIVTDAGSGYQSMPSVEIAAPITFGEGLIAYLTFDGHAIDETGSGYDGTIVGALLAPDRHGVPNRSYRFDGIDDRIALNQPLPDNPELTIAGWILRTPGSEQANRTMLSDSTIASGNDFEVYIPAGSDGFFVVSTKNGAGLNAGPTRVLPVEKWAHFAIVLATSGTSFYLDGRLVKTASETGNNIGFHGTPTIGASDHSGTRASYFQGSIDDIRIYGRALSSEEIRAIYRYEAPPRPPLVIEVKTVVLRMNLEPGRSYRIYSSKDLVQWTAVGEAFIATLDEMQREIDASEAGRYFRLESVE